MAAVSSEWFCLVLCLLLCSSEAQEDITAEHGQDVTLPCKVLNNKTIIVVEWTRPELDPDHVLLYRYGKLISDIQHPSFKNRVYLQDRDMKDGNVSLILKNVMKNDTGRYECRIVQRETNRRKRSSSPMKLITTINLEVPPPGGEDGGRKGGGDKDGIVVGSVVVVILSLALMASVGVLIYRRQMRQRSHLHVPPDEAADEQMF